MYFDLSLKCACLVSSRAVSGSGQFNYLSVIWGHSKRHMSFSHVHVMKTL